MGCDLACQTKIILNSGNITGIAQSNNEVIRRMTPEDFDRVDDDLIKILNRMEDDAVKVQKMLVKAVGYDGPTGKMLE